MDANLVGSVGVLLALGTFFLVSGWYYYRGRSAAMVLKNRALFRMFPGAACGLPLCGLACIGLAIALLISPPIKQLLLGMSVFVGLVALVFVGWCPRCLLPKWMRGFEGP